MKQVRVFIPLYFLLPYLSLVLLLPGCFPPFRKPIKKSFHRSEYHDSTDLKGYRIVQTRSSRMKASNVPDMENGTEIDRVWIYDPKGELVFRDRLKTRKFGCVTKTISRKTWVRKGQKIPGKYKAAPSHSGK